MRELRVNGAGDHLRVDGVELVDAVTERDDLSGADEGAGEEHRTVWRQGRPGNEQTLMLKL